MNEDNLAININFNHEYKIKRKIDIQNLKKVIFIIERNLRKKENKLE
jgi:hypothetical protein